MLPSVRRTRTWRSKKQDHLDSIFQGLSMICQQSSLDVTGWLLETFRGFLGDLRLNALSALSGNANKAKPPIW
jgi:hypothetical protein